MTARIGVTCDGGLEFQFDPASTALLVIDMQRDFMDRDGRITP